MKLVTVGEMRAIEKQADSRGVNYEQMMENAGLSLASVVNDTYGGTGAQWVTGLVGSGNNGGDTLVALTALEQLGWKATAYLARARQQDDPLLASFVEAGGQVTSAEDDHDFEQLVDILSETDVVLDGILGTGSQLPLKPELAHLLQQVAEYRPEFTVVAVDCPSGVDCDSGEAAPETLEADMTVCMAAVKVGLLKFPAFNLIGQLAVVGIGLPEDLPALQSINFEVVTAADVRAAIPERKRDAHKGTFGTALVIAGSMNYTGAAYLAGKAAYRAGAGLVRLAVPGPLHTVLAGQLPEATWLLLPHSTGVVSENAMDVIGKNLDKVTAMLVGPGLGMEDTTALFIKRLASGKTVQPVRSSIGFVFSPVPNKVEADFPVLPAMVIDADGLKLLAKIPEWFGMIPAPAVLTPHPGEMAVLTGLNLDVIQADRIAIASRFAREWGHVVVLKGAISIIADPDGRVRVIPVATAALARAGTGDVLAGLITGLRAQGLSAFDAASAGAWIHAQAGLAAAGELGSEACVMASDVLEALPEVFSTLEQE